MRKDMQMSHEVNVENREGVFGPLFTVLTTLMKAFDSSVYPTDSNLVNVRLTATKMADRPIYKKKDLARTFIFQIGSYILYQKSDIYFNSKDIKYPSPLERFRSHGRHENHPEAFWVCGNLAVLNHLVPGHGQSVVSDGAVSFLRK